MKFIFVLFVFIYFSAFSQDCSTLDDFRTFHGIKFGKTFPDSLKDFFGVDSAQIRSGIKKYVIYSFLSDVKPLDRFANWFEFGSKFDQIAFSCNRSDEVMEITLSTLFPVKNTTAFTSKNYPLFFKRILTELKSLFGSPTISDKKYMKGTTIIYAYSWQCNTMVAIATCSYQNKEASYNLTLFDMNLKKKQEVDIYKNPN